MPMAPSIMPKLAGAILIVLVLCLQHFLKTAVVVQIALAPVLYVLGARMVLGSKMFSVAGLAGICVVLSNLTFWFLYPHKYAVGYMITCWFIMIGLVAVSVTCVGMFFWDREN